jgi:hypothetical protein
MKGMTLGKSLYSVVNNMFMEHFKEIALYTADHKPLNGSDTSTTLSWYGHMGQQDCGNFFTTSTTLDLPFKKEVEANDNLSFLDVSVMKRGPKLATKVYRKPAHRVRYLHFKYNHPHHVKREAIHGSIYGAKFRVRRISTWILGT